MYVNFFSFLELYATFTQDDSRNFQGKDGMQECNIRSQVAQVFDRKYASLSKTLALRIRDIAKIWDSYHTKHLIFLQA